MVSYGSNRLTHIKSNVWYGVFSELEQARTDDAVVEFSRHFRMYFVNLVYSHDAHHELFVLSEFLYLVRVDLLEPLFIEVLFA